MTPVPHGSSAARIALALAIGLLVGFEREWSNKDAGIRTCAIVALIGMLAALVSVGLAIAGLVAVMTLAGFINLRELRTTNTLEITTSAALLLVYVLGVLVGRGEMFTPVAAAIGATLLLAWKFELHRFAGALRPNEVRGAIWLGLLAFVIYPLLPNRTVDAWGLINPHSVWVAVIVVAAVEFANYVLMRLYSARGIYYSAVLGGLVSSAATVVELGALLKPVENGAARSLTVTLLATVAMFARNLILLALFAPTAVASAWLPLASMSVAAGLLVWRGNGVSAQASPGPAPEPGGAEGDRGLRLESPLSIRQVLEFGAFFLLIQIATRLGDRYLGSAGVYAASVLGGILNSASATAAAGELVSHHALTPVTAGIVTLLASMTSAVANAALMGRSFGRRELGWRNEMLAGLLIAVGAIAMVIQLVM